MDDNYFFDDKWAEQIYNILSKLTHEQKARLNSKEINFLKSDNSIKRFANTASIKRQMVLLTRLGYDWFFGLYPAGKMLPDVMKKAYRQQIIKDTRVEVIQEMIESHIFIIDNKAVALSLAMMATNSHSDIFVINNEFLKLPKMLDEYQRNKNPLANLLREHNPNNAAAEYKDAIRGLERMSELISETLRMEDYLITVLQLTKIDFWILHHLFRHRNNYVSIDYLKRQMSHSYLPKAISARCTYLWKEKGYIDKMPKTTTASYTIKSDGILILGEVLNMIINRSLKA